MPANFFKRLILLATSNIITFIIEVEIDLKWFEENLTNGYFVTYQKCCTQTYFNPHCRCTLYGILEVFVLSLRLYRLRFYHMYVYMNFWRLTSSVIILMMTDEDWLNSVLFQSPKLKSQAIMNFQKAHVRYLFTTPTQFSKLVIINLHT